LAAAGLFGPVALSAGCATDFVVAACPAPGVVLGGGLFGTVCVCAAFTVEPVPTEAVVFGFTSGELAPVGVFAAVSTFGGGATVGSLSARMSIALTGLGANG
jgi:hypothetical protein